MNSKSKIVTFVSGLYLSLSLMSAFMFSTMFDTWRGVIDLDKLYSGGTHYLGLLLAYVLIFAITYIFANSSKHMIKFFVDMEGLSPEMSKGMMDRISLVANFFTIFFYLSTILERTFLQGFRDEFQRLAIVMTMLLMSLAVNNHLDRKFRHQEQEFGNETVHFILSVPILTLNGILLIGFFDIIIFG